MKIQSCAALMLAMGSFAARADVKPASLFTDHAILQRDAVVPVWGNADPNEAVSISFADQKLETKASTDGSWRVNLPAMAASATPREMTIEGAKNFIVLRDILVGEVWVCSGQSNMTFALNRAKDAQKEIAAADHPLIRLFDVPRVPSAIPATNVDAKWNASTPQTAQTFSAVAYFYGVALQKELNVPIGLIHSSWGGTVAQSWSPRKVMEDPRFSKALDREKERLTKLPQQMKAYEEALKKWRASSAQEKSSTTKPVSPTELNGKGGPTHLFNGMIAPLIPYSVRGVLWFQGESNRKDPNHYRLLLPEMIKGWRSEWGQLHLPFVMVQLANYQPPEAEVDTRSQWAEIREVQRLTSVAIPDAALVVTIDLGESKDLHPKNKQDVGKRAAMQAMRLVYGKQIIASGPTFKSVKFDGDKAVLTFNDIGSGLAMHGDSLSGFTIAGKDRKFVPAEAKLDGNTVIVRSDSVSEPVAVRYAWSADPRVSLYNKEGFPAGPFRTDDWPWAGPAAQPNANP